MPFSWKKPTTTFFSRALIATLTLTVAFSSTTALFQSASAEPIPENSKSDRSTKVSYAQELSEVKESILTTEEDIESKKAELETAQSDLAKLKQWDDWKGDDIYGGACLCSEKTSCDVSKLLSLGIINEEDTKSIRLRTNGCDDGSKPSDGGKPGYAGDANSAKPNTIANSGRTKTSEGDDKADLGTGGGNSSGKNKSGVPCVSKLAISDSVNQAAVCSGIYTYAKEHGRASTGLNALCVEAARNCGAVKYLTDKENLPKTIADLKKEIARLEKEKKKLVARRKSIDTACPDCSAIADAADRPALGDYIVGGLQAISPMVIAGIQAGSYNKYLRTSSNAYNSYLNGSLANCQAYISQGTTLGVPSSPCQSAMWSGGVAQAPGYGGYGVYGSIGMSAGVGMMYGMPGYGAGYGAYGYGGGSMGGTIGVAVGTMYGGGYSMGMPGYGGYGGGYSMGMPGYGGYGGGYSMGMPGYGGGYSMGMPGYGGGYAVGTAMGVGYGGGYSMGMPGYGGGYSMGMPGYGGGYSMGTAMGYGGYSGNYGNTYGGYASSMGYTGGYGYGVDPSMQLNAARSQMQGQNMQISQQQMMEAQYRNQQVMTTGYGGYGYGYGTSYGGAYGMPAYGYGGAYTGGYGAQVIGTAIGSLYGTAY